MKKIFFGALLTLCFYSPPLFAQWSQINLPSAKIQMGIAAYNEEVYMAGGNNGFYYTPRIDIYNLDKNEWTTASLSMARSFPVGLTLNNEILFAGGYNTASSDVVDIYNVYTKERKTAKLSEARFSIAALAYQHWALWAGGANVETLTATKRVDIYDQKNQKWSVDSLSEARCAMGFAIVGGKAYFAGGYKFNNQVSDRVDIYDFESQTWEQDTLSLARGLLSAAVSGSQIIFAGGITADSKPTDHVDIYDTVTQSWSQSNLSVARAFIDNGASSCDKAFFVGGCYFDMSNNIEYHAFNIVDIYDASSRSWQRDSLPQFILDNAVLATGNYVISAGGATNVLAPMTYSNIVNVYRCIPTSTNSPANSDFLLLPNPCSDFLQIQNVDLSFNHTYTAILYDILGNQVFSKSLSDPSAQIDVKNIPNGLYFFVLRQNGQSKIQGKKMIIQH